MQTTLLPARLIYTPSAFVQQVCRAQRRYSFFISTRNNTIFEKRGKGKRIERDELKEANIHASRANTTSRSIEQKGKKLEKKHVGYTPNARKTVARRGIVFLRKGNIFSKIVLRHTKLSYSIEIMLLDFIVLRER